MQQENKSLDVRTFTVELLPLAEQFCSGDTYSSLYIDRFLKNGDYSLNTNIGKTYVFLSEDENCIIGFYNLGVGSVDRVEYNGEKEIRKRMGGAININYFALDERFQGQVEAEVDGYKIYLSDLLLDDCLQRIEKITSESIGATFVTLNSTEAGYYLYTRNGFDPLEEDMSVSMEDSDKKCMQLYRCINEEF